MKLANEHEKNQFEMFSLQVYEKVCETLFVEDRAKYFIQNLIDAANN